MIAWATALCLLFLLPPPAAHAAPEVEGRRVADPERPRIALVLSGGGARGGAHLGVIRVLEQLQIPVDMIVGTSGGAIVGGLYAGGWSPAEIEDWLENMDWDVALADRLPRRNLPYREKADDDRFLFDLQIGLGDSGVQLPRSLIQGRNLAFILEQATLRTAAIRQFDRLPIPFRAVATDLETAEKVVLKEGRLSRAIHASMAVPGIFEPVSVDGRLLVDGGLVDNLPVATAREMGADIIIAVNVGTRLKSRDSLRDIFDISVQVTALIVDSNIQASLDRLTERDVLIEPILKEIGSQDFPRTLEAAESGETAAREARKTLQPLSVDDEAYGDWLRSQRVAEPEIEELQTINFFGLDRLTEERLLALMETRPGSPVTIDQLQDDIGRLQRLGEIEALDFQLVEREEGTELDLRIDERQGTAHHLRLGFEIFDEFDGGGRYNLRLGHSRPGLNRLGAEWRNELQIGRTRAVRTEFYQPLAATERVFLSLPASHETEPMPVFQDGTRTGEVSFRESRASLDLGLRLGRHGELRLGPWRGRLGSKPHIGSDQVPPLDRDTGGWHLSLDYDRLDDTEWPSEGQLIEAEAEYHRVDMGADEALRTSMVRFAQYWPAGSDRFLLAGEWAEADRPLPYQQQFGIGGPFSLPGYRRGELRGERVATLRAVWFRQLASADLGRQAGAFFVGAGVAAGNAWAHGEGSSARDPAWGTQAFIGAGTPLGPVVAGVNQSDASETVFFLSLGIPIHRPRSDTSPW